MRFGYQICSKIETVFFVKFELSRRRQDTFRGFRPSNIEPESNKNQSRGSDTRFHHPFDDSGSISGPRSASKSSKNRIKNQTTKTEPPITFSPYPLQGPPTRPTMSDHTSSTSRWSLFGTCSGKPAPKSDVGNACAAKDNLQQTYTRTQTIQLNKPLKINKTHAQTHQTIQFRISEIPEK